MKSASQDRSETEIAVDFIVAKICEARPQWTEAQAREMVGYAREYIASDPQRFVDDFLDNIAAQGSGEVPATPGQPGDEALAVGDRSNQ